MNIFRIITPNCSIYAAFRNVKQYVYRMIKTWATNHRLGIIMLSIKRNGYAVELFQLGFCVKIVITGNSKDKDYAVNVGGFVNL